MRLRPSTALTTTLLALLTFVCLLPTAQGFHHPRLGRFVQRDPLGYVDGMNGYGYTGGSPVDDRDPEGLWIIMREGKDKARAIAEDRDSIQTLAIEAGLDPAEFKRWLTLPMKNKIVIRTNMGNGLKMVELKSLRNAWVIAKGCSVEIPNTLFAYWAGEFGGVGKAWVEWDGDVRILKNKGFKIDERSGLDAKQFEGVIQDLTKSKKMGSSLSGMG